MTATSFNVELFEIGTWTLVLLPKNVSAKFPSRGLVMAKGTINGKSFETTMEPDGFGSHWFRVDEALQKTVDLKAGPPASAQPASLRETLPAGMLKALRAGDIVKLTIEPSDKWPEPQVPEDLQNALTGFPQAHSLWKKITPMARWDWIRWIRGTKVSETRRKRIEVACSKLNKGMRRPCCFNRTACTEPYVSSKGALLEPMQIAEKNKV